MLGLGGSIFVIKKDEKKIKFSFHIVFIIRSNVEEEVEEEEEKEMKLVQAHCNCLLTNTRRHKQMKW